MVADGTGSSAVEHDRIEARVRARLFARPEQPILVGRYRLCERVGGGGQGTVYRAHDPKLDRTVAIKVLHGSKRPARAEARALAQLSHPNVLQVFEWGEHRTADGQTAHYIVTEFVSGTSLEAWASSLHSRDDRLGVLVDVARGLRAAHAAGLVHGDVKPSNILVGDDGRARLADFGIATASGTESGKSGQLEGTEGYIAPERREGSVEASIDQYGFCVVARELLATSDVSIGLRRALARGTSSRPADRFASINPLYRRLRSELEARTGGRRAHRLMLGGIACTVGLLGATMLSPDDACRDWIDGSVNHLWAEIDDGGPDAPAARMKGRATEWVEAWRAARLEACEKASRGDEPARGACLDGQLDEMQLVLAISDPAARAEGIAALASPGDCSMTAPRPAEDDPRAEDATTALRAANLASRKGDPQEALRLAEAALRDAEGLAPGLVAELWYTRGSAAFALNHVDDTDRWSEDALWRARAAGLHRVEAQAALLLSQSAALFRHDLPLARRWARFATRAAEQVRGIALECHLQRHAAFLARLDGDFAGARSLLKGLAERAPGLERARALKAACILETIAGEDAAETVSVCRKAVAAFRVGLGPEHPHTLSNRQSLGAALEIAGQFDEARAVLEEVVALQRGGDAEHLFLSLNSLGVVLEQQDSFELAQQTYEEALEVLGRVEGAPAHYAESLHVNLASLGLQLGKGDAAERHYRRAFVSIEQRAGAEHPDLMSPLWGLGEAFELQGRLEQATATLEQAIALGEKSDVGPAILSRPRVALSRVLKARGVEADRRRALALRAVRDLQAHAPDLEDLIAEATALAES